MSNIISKGNLKNYIVCGFKQACKIDVTAGEKLRVNLCICESYVILIHKAAKKMSQRRYTRINNRRATKVKNWVTGKKFF